jgi:hypothetical protein
MGNIEWDLPDNTSSSSLRVAFISSSAEGASANNRGSILIFATKTDGVSGAGTERMRIDSSGNVGIGTTSPSQKVQIAGGSIQLDTATSVAFGNINTRMQGASDGSFIWYGSGSERMRIDSSGNVGIGTTTPVAQLGVYGAGQTTAAMSTSSGLGGTLYVRDSAGAAGNGGAVMFGATQGAFAAIKGLITDGANNTLGALAFSTRNASTDATLTERMRISPLGDVGIGTSSPSSYSKLAVLGADAGGFTGITSINSNSGTGIAGVQFSSDSTYVKAAIGLLRAAPNGVGSIVFYNDSNTDAANWSTGDEKMRIDSSGNVGIGQTSITRAFANYNQLNISGSSGATIQMQTGSTINTNIVSDGNALYLATLGGSGSMQFAVGGTGTGTERMRIDSSGNVMVGTTNSAPGNGSGNNVSGFAVNANGTTWASRDGFAALSVNRVDTTGDVLRAASAGNQVGGISVTSSATAFNTSSDYRLKQDIAPMTGALIKVAALKPVTYKWKRDGSDGEGFIAHELAEVCPQAVTGDKDAVDADGNPIHQGIDTSFLIATLTAAIQEQQALITQQAAAITSLTARIVALEST